MKSLKKQRRIQIIGLSLCAIVGVFIVLAFLPKDAVQLFRSPSEVLADPPSQSEYFQLGGLVKEGSMSAKDGVRFSFVITDRAAEVDVRYVGNDPAPDLFEEGQGTIVKGNLVNGIFEAKELLAKHDETYMPAEVIDALKEQGVYQGPQGNS